MDFENEESSWNVLGSVFHVFESYGWHILILSIIVAIVYNRKVKPILQKYYEYKFEQEYAAKYHKNPDLLSAHVSGQQLWANKLQEKYNKQAEDYQQKQKEKEERRRQEYMEKYGTDDGGNVLGNGKKDGKQNNTLKPGSNVQSNGKKDGKQNNTLKPESFPLMGSGSGSNYRPPKRSACGGGGCGR